MNRQANPTGKCLENKRINVQIACFILKFLFSIRSISKNIAHLVLLRQLYYIFTAISIFLLPNNEDIILFMSMSSENYKLRALVFLSKMDTAATSGGADLENEFKDTIFKCI